MLLTVYLTSQCMIPWYLVYDAFFCLLQQVLISASRNKADLLGWQLCVM